MKSRNIKTGTREKVGIEVRMRKEPWICKPLELLFHAETHYRTGKDYDKRLSFISFDNSIEISILTYMHRNCKPKGNKKYTEKDISEAEKFHKKLKVFEKIVTTKGLPMEPDIETIKYYHEQRNKLYHEETRFPPESTDLDDIRGIAFWVFGVLFEMPDVNAALEELGEMSEKTFPSIPEGYAKPKIVEMSKDHTDSLVIAAILGAWHENSEGDKNIIREITDGF